MARTEPVEIEESARRATYEYIRAFFEELVRCGLETVCVSPGSRSTPLTVSASRTAGLSVLPILDERSAGFFALGLARRSEKPVALVCTSGTAASNYLPAVTESHYGRVPLLILTADRPPELREFGAGQTIDQSGLYGAAVRRFVEVPVPTGGPALERHARALACRAIDDAMAAPAGPVHLNFPLREPLEPPTSIVFGEGRASADPITPRARVTRSLAAPCEEDIRDLVSLVRGQERGVIACGPMPPSLARDRALAELAVAAGWPILADPTSGLRCGEHVPGAPILGHSDLWLRDARLARTLAPDVVIRLGDTPVSKAFRLWVEGARPGAVVLVDPDRGWADPSHLATRVIRADPVLLARAVCGRLSSARRDTSWLRALVGADRRAADAIQLEIDREATLDEPRAVTELAARLPADSTLYLSNSMPVRDVDAFWPIDQRPLRVLCNRGANGIDGVTSSALGAAYAGLGPVVLLTGDLALLHDLGALLTARTASIPLLIVVLNNDGGGIFSFLPIATQANAVDFERLFRTPHGLDLGGAAALFGLGYTHVKSWDHYAETLDELLASPLRRTHIVELPIDRDTNLARFRQLADRAARAAAQGMPE